MLMLDWVGVGGSAHPGTPPPTLPLPDKSPGAPRPPRMGEKERTGEHGGGWGGRSPPTLLCALGLAHPHLSGLWEAQEGRAWWNRGPWGGWRQCCWEQGCPVSAPASACLGEGKSPTCSPWGGGTGDDALPSPPLLSPAPSPSVPLPSCTPPPLLLPLFSGCPIPSSTQGSVLPRAHAPSAFQ